MTRINQQLLARMEQKLGVSRARVYSLIGDKGNATNLPRNLAALALARERGINVTLSKYATKEELAELRNAGSSQSARGGGSESKEPLARPSRSVSAPAPQRASSRRTGTTVFVVHGRDEEARQAMFSFLRTIGLHPLEWTQALALTRNAAPYVGEVLDKAFEKATAVVVLITPDDEARLRPDLLRKGDGKAERTLAGQARPNVLFEAGMAFGSHPKSTVLVQLGKCRPFSDVGGRHVVHLDNSVPKRIELITKLKSAGCPVNQAGTDWTTAGDFGVASARVPAGVRARTKK